MSNDLGKRISDLLKQNGLSQKELAEKLGVKPEAVYKWAAGTNTPTYDVIYLLKKMGATDYELFSETFSEQEAFFKKQLMKDMQEPCRLFNYQRQKK